MSDSSLYATRPSEAARLDRLEQEIRLWESMRHDDLRLPPLDARCHDGPSDDRPGSTILIGYVFVALSSAAMGSLLTWLVVA